MFQRLFYITSPERCYENKKTSQHSSKKIKIDLFCLITENYFFSADCFSLLSCFSRIFS